MCSLRGDKVSMLTHTYKHKSLRKMFCLLFFFTQYITQIVQMQTQHAHAHDQRDNKLIVWLLSHSHDIVLCVLKQQMLLDGLVF